MELLLHERLRAVAREAPERIAVTCAGRSLDYGSLASLARRIAASLRGLGVRKGDLVGTWLAKSPEAIAACFGALEAGAAYVPIDASTPAERVARIFERGGLRLLIADAPPPPAVRAVCGDAWTVLASLGEADPLPEPVEVGPGDLAYVHFTSGSTGLPKGVPIRHGAAEFYLSSCDRLLGREGHERIANHAPFSFDLASFDIHLAVRWGATLHLIPEAVARMPGSMLRFFEEAKPNLLYTVPTTLHRLAAISSIDRVRVPSMRSLLFAGEKPNPAALERLRPVFPNASFHNWYGSTEAALVTTARFPQGTPLPDPMPMGDVLPGIDLALAEDDGRLAPLRPGSRGELLVSGPLVFDGYLGISEPADSPFVEAPIEGGPTEPRRWFKTRDRVEVDPAGAIFLVGRTDRMVKLRGMRADLGEIEAALLRQERVKQCAVVTRPDPKLGHRVFAFVVCDPEGVEALGPRLREALPAYMLPERMIAVSSLPLTASGKVDRRALAEKLDAIDSTGSNPLRAQG